MEYLSHHTRVESIEHMKNNEYDLLIIGGGITGAGIALDAITRGLKVGLIEMGDYAHGTSSRSTKLVHGGLRYRSEEHTSELQSRFDLVCRLLLEKKQITQIAAP